jgi:hypothetical protein
MARTFLIDKPLFNSDAHESATRIERALREGGVVNSDGVLVTQFNFDLLGFVHDLKTPRLKDESLSRLCFSIDAYISGALSKMLNEFYQHSKTDASPLTFGTYNDFLRHIEGIEATEQSLYDTGCDVKSSVDRIRNLVAFRDELHAQRAGRLIDPSQYVQPDIREFLGKPQMRTLSAAAELGLQDIVQDDAGDDKELAAELLAQYKLDSQLERMNQHRMDLMKAKSLVLLFNCLKADPGANVNDEDDAFFDMDARTQYGLMNSCMRSILDTRRKAVTDNRVSVMEKATLRVEAKAAVATLTQHLAHAKFAEFVAA